MSFQKSTEDIVKSSVPTAHPGVALAYNVVMGGAALALLATLAAGVPIAYAGLRQAFTARRWGIVALFAVPPISLAVWLGWTLALRDVVASPQTASGPNTSTAHLFFLSWIGLFVLAAIVSVAAVSVAIARSEVRPELFRFALAPEVGLALGMLVTVAGMVAWNLQMQSYAPSFLNSPNGPDGIFGSTGGDVLVHIAVMALATVIVIVGIVRGYSARHTQAAA
jgi:hypothetical protein